MALNARCRELAALREDLSRSCSERDELAGQLDAQSASGRRLRAKVGRLKEEEVSREREMARVCEAEAVAAQEAAESRRSAKELLRQLEASEKEMKRTSGELSQARVRSRPERSAELSLNSPLFVAGAAPPAGRGLPGLAGGRSSCDEGVGRAAGRPRGFAPGERAAGCAERDCGVQRELPRQRSEVSN